ACLLFLHSAPPEIYPLSLHDALPISVKLRKERIGRLLQMHANHRDEIKEVRAGDIAAAVGLKDVTTGDTLCDVINVIMLERMELDRKSTRLNSSHVKISYAVFCLKKK